MPQRIPYHQNTAAVAASKDAARRAARRQADSPSTKLYESRFARLADKRFYAGKAWRELRAEKIRANPLCEACLAKGKETIACHVHHKLERKEWPDLALRMDNLESVCIPCHNAKRKMP